MCGAVGGCSAGSAQEQWLRNDLAASTATCTLAYWHHPRFSSGSHGSDPDVQPLWQALNDRGADVVLNGHDHDYERFAPQSPTGIAEPLGLRQFVVGTGGANLVPFESPIANSQVRSATTFGVLRLTLHSSSYEWAFVPETAGGFSDTGQDSCH
jgi:Calcineurin-like phosphoesterase